MNAEQRSSFDTRVDAIQSAGVVGVDIAVAAFAQALEIAVPLAVEKLAVDLHTKITRRNPVDTGLSRSRWTIREGEPDNSPVPEKLEDGSRTNPPAPAAMPPNGISGKEIVFITNNVEYVTYLEAGSSQQAPSGMVAISIFELEAEAEQILKQFEGK